MKRSCVSYGKSSLQEDGDRQYLDVVEVGVICPIHGQSSRNLECGLFGGKRSGCLLVSTVARE